MIGFLKKIYEKPNYKEPRGANRAISSLQPIDHALG